MKNLYNLVSREKASVSPSHSLLLQGQTFQSLLPKGRPIRVQGIAVPKWDGPLGKETEESPVNYRGFSRANNLVVREKPLSFVPCQFLNRHL